MEKTRLWRVLYHLDMNKSDIGELLYLFSKQTATLLSECIVSVPDITG